MSAIMLVLNTAHDSIRSSRYPGITSTSMAVSSRHEPCQIHVFFTPHLQIWALKIENSIGCWTPVAVNKKKRPIWLDNIILWELIIHLIKSFCCHGHRFWSNETGLLSFVGNRCCKSYVREVWVVIWCHYKAITQTYVGKNHFSSTRELVIL